MSADLWNQDVLILIPARYASTRFPGKPLSKILGISMIQRVYDNCADSGIAAYVVTDNDEIEEHVREFGGQVLRVDDDVPSGTQRIKIALDRYFKDKIFKYVINVQGDEPLLSGEDLKKLVQFHMNSDFSVTTFVSERPYEQTIQEFEDWHKVKAVLGENGRCLYFSRSPVPYDRYEKRKNWHLHIGVYCYTMDSLNKFINYEATELEGMECLEQLRLMSHGETYGAEILSHELIGVDNPEDIQKVETRLRELGHE